MDVLVGSLNDAGFQVIPEVQVSLQNVELDLTFIGFVMRYDFMSAICQKL